MSELQPPLRVILDAFKRRFKYALGHDGESLAVVDGHISGEAFHQFAANGEPKGARTINVCANRAVGGRVVAEFANDRRERIVGLSRVLMRPYLSYFACVDHDAAPAPNVSTNASCGMTLRTSFSSTIQSPCARGMRRPL